MRAWCRLRGNDDLEGPIDGRRDSAPDPGGGTSGERRARWHPCAAAELVGGYIQAIPPPDFIEGSERTTAYINEEGKFDPDCRPNMRATDFLVPGVGLFWGDHIAGPMLVCGFDPSRGEHLDLPPEVERRIRLIEDEAG